MPLCRNDKTIRLLMTAIFFLTLLPLASAQDRQPSKTDIFAGYAWADAGSHGYGNADSMPRGFNLASTYWFNRNWGFTLDGGNHWGDRSRLSTLQIGPSIRFPGENVSPFVHALVGMYAYNPGPLGRDINLGLTFGGGLDLRMLPRVDFRLIQADLQYGRHHGPGLASSEFVGPRLATGLVFKFGSIGPPPPPPAAACSAQPTEVFEGEPVAVTVTPSNFNPKRTLAYAWSGTGVTVTGTAANANVDTKGLQPGSYTVKANVTDGKKGMAECTTSFTVKSPRGPTISCSANPSTVRPGDSSTITSTGNSPDGRQLTYSYTASAGSISGDGSSTTLATTGAEPGPITVTCNVKDDRNLSASNSTTVTVEAPPPPPAPPAAPEASRLNQISFKNNSARVDNAAKAILDDVALRLQRDADAKVVIVGSNEESEKAKALPGTRALNAKAYLVKEKGIDPSRIAVRSGAKEGTIAIIWLVPAGATAPEEGTTAVKEPRR
ncbi:MAG TPA: OmpA family protein [Terriglobales bacterium]|nr:OmpA family protein [Terriglobales bacterium]